MPETLTSIELFTGAGGLALGVAKAGFEHRLLLEYNRVACATLRANRAAFGGDRCALHEGDVRAVDFTPFCGVDLLAAGAPCQPFSIGGKHRADKDDRNLFPEVFRAVVAVQPRAILVENVRGLLRPSLREFVEYIELQLTHPTVLPGSRRDPRDWAGHLPTLRRADQSNGAAELHYRVHRLLLNAADYGVPQIRHRVFFVALRSDVETLWAAPLPTHSQFALRVSQEATGDYWRGHRIKRRTNRGHPKLGAWLAEAGNRYPWATVRDAISGLPDPIRRGASESFPNHVAQPGARSYPGHTGSPLDAPAKALKAGVHGVPGGENMLRRANGTVRYFTVREAARIQTFPDSYTFSGPWGEAMRQIGNAVPVDLAAAVATSIANCLARAPKNAQPNRQPLPSYVQTILPGI